MTVKISDIERAARLSSLEISNEDYDLFMKRIERVFDWVETLQRIKTKDVVPLGNPMENFPEFQQGMYADIPDSFNLQNEILSNAPESEHAMFKVNKVIE
jgi:aspartyl-tRNA(Asn)/glutamyl-tRNA(Gln) amidotransferase subunit C